MHTNKHVNVSVIWVVSDKIFSIQTVRIHPYVELLFSNDRINLGNYLTNFTKRITPGTEIFQGICLIHHQIGFMYNCDHFIL